MYIPELVLRVLVWQATSANLDYIGASDEARDNGYHLFRYLSENCPDINVFYAIKDGREAEKVRQIGNTISFRSYRHCVMFISAECILSTGFDLGYPSDYQSVFSGSVVVFGS
ncbi:MAG: hypothetical protein ACNYPI_02205 [Arenicellales bacterium WSBS_2016_MAG_OTU3]